VHLQRRLDARGVDIAWPDLRRDLAQVEAVTVTLDGQRDRLCTDLTGDASRVRRRRRAAARAGHAVRRGERRRRGTTLRCGA
jgi:hypothetical protein